MKSLFLVCLVVVHLAGATGRRIHGFTRQEWTAWMSAPDAGGPWDDLRWAQHCAQGAQWSTAEWLGHFAGLHMSAGEWVDYWLDDNDW